MKPCSKCQTTKRIEDFYLDRGTRRSECKECTKVDRRARHAANPDIAQEYARAYARSSQGRVRRRETALLRSKTPEFKAYSRAWGMTESGRAARRGRVNRYAQTPLGRAAIARRHTARRARERVIINTLTAAEWAAIMAEHNDACAYCGVTFTAAQPATQDHVRPISRGGHHVRENVVPACRPCNSRKRDRC